MKSTYENLVKCKTAWLITWDWIGNHAKVENSFVGIFNYRYSSGKISRILEQLYVTSRFAIHEQLAYAINRKSSPYQAQLGTVEISKEIQEKLDLPNHVPSSDSLMCGGNPWLWARIVHEVEAYTDEVGNEFLKWKERRHTILQKGKLSYELEACQYSF